MLFTDINVLVYAHRDEMAQHRACLRWLEDVTSGGEPFGLPEPVQHGFVRVVTNPRAFQPPTPMPQALAFIDALRASSQHHPVVPGPRHWGIFSRLCLANEARGNLVPDAYLAALAIEQDARLATCDGDFARFPGLRWFDPTKTK